MSRKSTLDDSALRKVLAERLWSAIEYEEISQADLADNTGLSKNTINNILYEKHTPSISAVVVIARYLKMSMDDLCGMDLDI